MSARLVAERYELRELLGEGGMGVVYRGIDTRTGGLVAIKTMRDTSDPRTLEMFKKEWQVLARLSHPNIVDIRDVNELEEDGLRKPCFVMPLLPGVTLAQLIKESSPRLTVTRLVGIISQVCNGLEAAHRHGLIHRDLKPSNIFVMEDDTAKIIDFGLVHSPDAHSITGYKGTWQYMAPEQTEGKEPTPESDIYAVGVVTYEGLTGRKPFARKSVEATIEAIRNYIPPSISEINPKVSQLLSKVIHKAMAKQSAHRYGSAKEFAETLQKACRNEPIERFEAAKILPRIERARKAFTRDDCAFASEILTEIEAEGNVDPEITLLRAQIEEAVKQKRIRQLFEAAQTRLEQDEIPLALDKLREILTLDPENAEALAMRKRFEEQRNKEQISQWMKLARQHVELHDFQEARQALKEVLNIRYDDSAAMQLLSEIDVQEKEAAKARADKEQLYGSALKAYQGGEISTALSKLEKILEVARRTPGATVPERDAVYQSFYNRVRSERDSIDNTYEDGRRFLNDKDFRKALEICNEMLARYPNIAQFQALKLKVEQAERQELSAYIAEVARSVDAEPDLDRRVNILEEACKRYPNEGQFQQSQRLAREQRDLVHSILAKARQYEEQTQFADAIGQWKILRNIHPQYLGIDYEIGQLEKRREQQSAEEKKARVVEQVDRSIENGAFAKAVELVQDALAEFPQDPELVVLERIARQGQERAREGDRLFEDARKARSEGRFDAATELLRDALKLDERNSGIRNALISLLVERAHSLLDAEDWRGSEPLAESAAQLDEHHPAVKRLRILIADAKRRDGITQCVADARQLQLSGNVRAALDRLGDGLSHYPGDTRLLQFQASLHNSLDPSKQQKQEAAVEPLVVRSQPNKGLRVEDAPHIDAAPSEGLTALFNRSACGGDSLVESRIAQSLVSAKPSEDNSEPPSIRDAKSSKSSDSPGFAVQIAGSAKTVKTAVRDPLRKALKKLRAEVLLQPRRTGVLLSGIALVVLLLAIGMSVTHRAPGNRQVETSSPAAFEANIPITVSPADATLTVNGIVRSERSLSLDLKKTYDVSVSRVGYEGLKRDGLAPDRNGWQFILNPEPLHLQVLTGERSGKILLDGQEIWNLQQGDLTAYALPADGNHHTLTARNQTGDLFKLDFQALPGMSPQVAPLATENLIVTTTLGDQASILSGSSPSYFNLPGQKAIEIARTGTALNLTGADPEQTMLVVSNGKHHHSIAVLHGNAPTLFVSLNANPNLGAITITTAAQAAQLFLDGKERTTRKPGSWHLLGISPGPHQLRLTAPGYADDSRTIQVDKGQDVSQSIEMKPASAMLIISGAVAGAEVQVDGVSVGALDSNGSLRTNVVPGLHKIEVQKDDFESASVTRAFSAGQPIELLGKEIGLKAFGILAFDITPPGATVQYRRVNEADWHSGSASGSVKVKSGNYEVRAAADRYDTESRTLFVASGENAKTRIELRRAISDTISVVTTRDFFQRPDEIAKVERDWYTGQGTGFLQLRHRGGFTLTFLKPDRVPIKHKGKKLEWRVSIYPDAELDYELDGQQLTRRMKANGKTTKSSAKIDASHGDSVYAVKLALEAHRVVLKNEAGMLLDEFGDDQRDWSHGLVFIRADQFFVVSAP